MRKVLPFFLVLLAGIAFAAVKKPAKPAAPPPKLPVFTVTTPGEKGVMAEIVVQYDATAGTGVDWEKAKDLPWHEGTSANITKYTVNYLRDGIKRMTGKELPVASKNDLSRGIVLTTLANAPAALQKDPAVVQALRNTGQDSYNDREAFFIRADAKRVLLIANTYYGLANAAAELLESVNYEVLGMGPDWIYVPDFRNRPLTFSITRAGRPSFYTRSLWATSGQSYGVGTLMMKDKLSHPNDESVDTSYRRWQVGTRIYGSSMPAFPGHAMQGYHRYVAAAMVAQRVTDGFLVPRTLIGPDATRPPASAENNGFLWLNDDTAKPLAGKAFMSNGKEWQEQNIYSYHANLDLSVPLVREVVFSHMKTQSDAHFAKSPDETFVFGFEPEDGGGYAVLDKLLKYKNWYPEYLAAEGVKFGQPYVLHGFRGLNQPNEIWDANAASDTVFGFANWLLREFDKWMATRPAEERVTAAGKKKTDLVRCSGYCYNYHDVPPNFNLDPRIRVMIASYPKNRGAGKWKQYVTQHDMASAYQRMLPREPSGDYLILSLAYYGDPSISGIPTPWSNAADRLTETWKKSYDAGIRAISIEMDFNYARFGLGYYLITKYLWNANLTPAQMAALRDRWLQRSFGSGWKEMKAYYDFMLPEKLPINAPSAWARAIRLIDAADKKIDPAKEPAAQRRVDDVKQFWYFHYLEESGKAKPDVREMKEFAWKGQMSYMNAMHMVTRKYFNTNNPAEAAGPDFSNGPAHYTHEETQVWWKQVLDYWQPTTVTMFADTTLANGQQGRSIDLNDLVMVKEFQCAIPDDRFMHNSGITPAQPFFSIALKAGDEIGCKLIWPFNPADGYYRQRDVPYGVDYWSVAKKAWEPYIDQTMTVQPSKEIQLAGKPYQLMEIRLKAPKAGTYRFELGRGGNASPLSSLDFDLEAGKYAGNPLGGFTFTGPGGGWTQPAVYFYIPKGAKRLDLEVWDTHKARRITFYSTLPAAGLKTTRTVDVSKMGVHSIPLNPGEDGTVASIYGNGFAFPYMYSLPSLWAKSPSVLLVPRGLAKADGLTIVE